MTAQAALPFSQTSCLILGGCGFLGYHIVGQLLHKEKCSRVYVVDRQVRVNVHDGAEYMQGDITDEQALTRLMDEIKPSVIFHAASPLASLPGNREAEYVRTNVEGTKTVLTVAMRAESVKALVYTSTIDVYVNPPHENVEENHALWPSSDKSNEYNRTKAIGDELVRAANCAQLRTVCIRPGHIYGERQSQGLDEILDACWGTVPLVQVGNGKNYMEVAWVENVALGHVLAAKALLKESAAGDMEGSVSGTAFNISDGAPVLFWHHVRIIWAAARGADALRTIVVVPGWVMIAVVTIVEWFLWIFTANTVKPHTNLRRTALLYCIYSHTYSIEKARRELGFEPVANHDNILAKLASERVQERTKTKQQ